MTVKEALSAHRRYRAPTDDGSVLIEPSRREWNSDWDANQSLMREARAVVFDSSLANLRRVAQHELVELAQRHTRRYLPEHLHSALTSSSLADQDSESGIIIAGHQPELFHSGVWAKSFALNDFARSCNAHAVNLIIDNDLCQSTGIRVPHGSVEEPHLEVVPFDASAEAVPWEARPLMDRQCFNSFAERIGQSSIVDKSSLLATELWREAPLISALDLSLGEMIAAIRHRFEWQVGLRNLEVPLSQVCQTDSFRRFVAAVLHSIDRFVDDHNRLLHEYRGQHRLRSRTHPVPDLVRHDDSIETPFWIWHRDRPVRRALFACPRGDMIELTDRDRLSIECNSESLCESLERLSSDGMVIRPRALMTTMYSRMILGSAFIHGIGGAKYDEITDGLIERFFGIEPPRFQVMTATIRLPLTLPDVEEADLRRINSQRRELRYHPETFAVRSGATVADGQEVENLIETKRRLIGTRPDSGSRKAWHDQLTEINQRLVGHLRHQLGAWEQEKQLLEKQWRAKLLLGSREFSFVLHPTDLPRRLAAIFS